MASWDVIGLGENSLDYVYWVPQWSSEASLAKMPIARQMIAAGGQVATAICTCAALGLRAKYIGSFGNDDNAARVRGELTPFGVDLSDSFARDAVNRYAVILVDGQGERTVLWHRDPALAIRPQELRPEMLSNARLLHVDDLDEEAAIAAARMALEREVLVTSDIDRSNDRTEELMTSVTIPIFSERVPEAMTGESDPERALRKLQRRRRDGMLCVTMGSRGAMLLDGDHLHHVDACDVETVDTTGAGDVFRGAFIYALLHGEAPSDILRFANGAAALSCTREGAIKSVPTLEEVDNFVRRGSG